jgi:hypothetical protein
MLCIRGWYLFPEGMNVYQLKELWILFSPNVLTLRTLRLSGSAFFQFPKLLFFPENWGKVTV